MRQKVTLLRKTLTKLEKFVILYPWKKEKAFVPVGGTASYRETSQSRFACQLP